MHNLKLNSVEIKYIPGDFKEPQHILCTKHNIFILKSRCVYLSEGVLIQRNVDTLDWISLENLLYMGNGSLFYCYNISTGETTEIVIPDGYSIHKWSPLQDKVALVNNLGILRIALLDGHSSQCTITGEYELGKRENSPFVVLGWGSQSTQFHGSEGKFAPKNVQEDPLAEEDNKQQSIEWRDDGDMLLVSYVQENNRIFKIFSSECEFLYESEVKPGLYPVLAWKPDGSLIASAQYSSNQQTIAFFERNGLYRHDLKLLSNIPVRKIQWNSSADILAVWQYGPPTINEITLWVCRNFKWYLKQSLIFKQDEDVNQINWCNKKWLEVITSKCIIRYSWRWDSDVSNLVQNDALGMVVVIDGCNLNVTVSSVSVIPPPLCLQSYDCGSPVNFVTFSSTGNYLAAVLNNYTVKLFLMNPSGLVMIDTIQLDKANLFTPLSLSHFIYNGADGILYAIKHGVDDSRLVQYDLKNGQERECICERPVTGILPIQGSTDIAIRTANRLLLWSADNATVLASDVPNSGSGVILFINNKYRCILVDDNKLYYNNKTIPLDVTSFICRSDGYLLLTTKNDKLFCFRSTEWDNLLFLNNNNDSLIQSRRIARDAVLINAIPNSRTVILQVPRGELEIINPRILGIDQIEKFLMSGRYADAYAITRTDRINTNILYDLDPKGFLTNVKEFVKDIHNCNYIDDFLFQLQDTNVTCDLYGGFLKTARGTSTVDKNKYIIVIDALISAMKSIDPIYYLQSVVTAYVRKGDLEAALSELKEARSSKVESNSVGTKSVDAVLQHLIVLTSVQKLYDTALGMDDMNLLFWVSSKSNLDPREYLPFLSELANMNENYRRYKICRHIGRYETGLKHLIKCDDVLEELTELVNKHELHACAVAYVRLGNKWYIPLLHLYAEKLRADHNFGEAGIMSLKAGEFSLAFYDFLRANRADEALNALEYMRRDGMFVQDKLLELASSLTKNKKYKEAAEIYEHQLNHYEKAISVYIEGNLCSNAYWLATKYSRPDIIVSDIKSAILSQVTELNNTLETTEQEFTKLKTRLQVIRHESLNEFRQRNLWNSDLPSSTHDVTENTTRDIDLESIASTNFSQYSKISDISSTSSKRKKKLERKILQVKEGSSLENIAIIRQLHIIITDVQNLSATVRELCEQLLLLFDDCYEQALKIHSKYEILMDQIFKSVNDIWPVEMLTPVNSLTIETRILQKNLEYLDVQYRFPPALHRTNWKLQSLSVTSK